MLLSKLIAECNRGNIASDYIRAPEIYSYMDKVLLDANDRLQANFPMVSDWADFVTQWNIDNPENTATQDDYSAIPDRYLRRIMPVGVARYFYMKDEEGESVGSDYFREYEKAMFEFVRDYLPLVPLVFQNNEGGYIEMDDAKAEGGFYYGDVY
jgi:hypothetical protein